MQWSAEARAEIERLLGRYPTRQAALLPTLALAQRELGSLSAEAMDLVAGTLEVPIARVAEVASFYTMLRTKPVGRFHIQVCHNLSCSMMGAEPLIEHIERKLGIKAGETTADGKFTLSRVECLGACGTAPVMQINDEYHESLTPQRVDEILGGLE